MLYRFFIRLFDINLEEKSISLHEVFIGDERIEIVNNIHDLRREKLINKISQSTKIILNSDATDKMIEIAKKMYPNTKIDKEGNKK